MNNEPHMNVNVLELPESGGTNVVGNPLWTTDSARGTTVVEADLFARNGSQAGAVRIHQLFGANLDNGVPHDVDTIEALGLTLVAAARAARAGR